MKKQKNPSPSDLIAISQKIVSKYLGQKWGDKPLIPNKKLRDIYTKIFTVDLKSSPVYQAPATDGEKSLPLLKWMMIG